MNKSIGKRKRERAKKGKSRDDENYKIKFPQRVFQ